MFLKHSRCGNTHMSAWAALATVLVFPSPTAGDKAVPAFGQHGVFSESVFNDLWAVFFGGMPTSKQCSLVQDVTSTDRALIEQDRFLASSRGFDPILCKASSWYVSAMRIDPCRVRSHRPNDSRVAIKNCSNNGKFSEVRLVLQPVGRHERGYFFPDAAIHMSFSSFNLKMTASKWRRFFYANPTEPQNLSLHSVREVLKGLEHNDAALMVSDVGQARWTFSRSVYEAGAWTKLRLEHGGFHESLSDADLSQKTVRTGGNPMKPVRREGELMDPLKTHPLQGSCIECHLADTQRPSRSFRQLGWGLGGESIVSHRTLAEAIFAAGELAIVDR